MARIIIVGGGVAGLCAGISAQLDGHSATVYERHFKAGGNLTAWDRRGYRIDNCIHWLTGTNPVTDLYKMWERMGALGNVELHRSESLYTFELDGVSISLGRSIDKLRLDMLEIGPEDKKETESFIRAVKRVTALCGISPKNNDRPASLVEKISAVPSVVKYFGISTGELASRFHSPVLRGFIESLMTDCFSAIALIIVFSTFTSGNGDIPYGSSAAMADRLAERFISLGGRLRLKQGVAAVEVENGRATSVVLDDGREEYADYVVITADPAVAFGTLLDKEYMPRALAKQYADPRMRRFSAYHAAFAFDGTELPFKNDIIFDIPEKYRAHLSAKHIVLREFSHEPTFSPEGKSIIQVMIYCFEEQCREFIEAKKDAEAYERLKLELASAMGELMTEKFPQLKGRLCCLDVWTPASYRRFVGSEIGSFMSFVFAAGVVPRKISAGIPGLKNVFLATQWQCAPGGLPIAAEAGVNSVKAIASAERRRRAANAARRLFCRRRIKA